MNHILMRGALLAALALPGAASAAVYEITFAGHVSSIDTQGGSDSIADHFSVGDSMTGLMRLDTDMIDAIYYTDDTVDGAGRQARYLTTVSAFEYTVDGHRFSNEGNNGELYVQNDFRNGSAAPDRDAILTHAWGIWGPSFGGLSPESMQFAIGADLTTLLANDDFPGLTALLVLAAGNAIGGDWNWLSFGTGETLRFDLTSISVTGDPPPVVPLPAGLPLMLSGLGFFEALRRWRRRFSRRPVAAL